MVVGNRGYWFIELEIVAYAFFVWGNGATMLRRGAIWLWVSHEATRSQSLHS
jgi:hypothetical protein